mgnify:CR=1 FL=1
MLMRKNYFIILIFVSKFVFSQTTNQIINIGSGSPSRFLNIIDKTIKKTNILYKKNYLKGFGYES